MQDNMGRGSSGSTTDKSAPPRGKQQQQPPAIAARKLSPEEMARLKANLFKPVVTPPKEDKSIKATKESDTNKKPPQKKIFGLF